MYIHENSHIDHSALATQCGSRTAALADQVAMQRAGHAEYGRLSGAMCWDSMLICACLAQGVNCQELQSACDSGRISLSPAIIDSDSYDRVFDLETWNVTSVNDLLNVTPGSFIGFIRPNNQLGHAMIYIGGGFGAGNKNDCVFSSGSIIGWEKLDLRDFFGDDAQRNAGTRMVARPVECQVF
jgi:hypothetical protein